MLPAVLPVDVPPAEVVVPVVAGVVVVVGAAVVPAAFVVVAVVGAFLPLPWTVDAVDPDDVLGAEDVFGAPDFAGAPFGFATTGAAVKDNIAATLTRSSRRRILVSSDGGRGKRCASVRRALTN